MRILEYFLELAFWDAVWVFLCFAVLFFVLNRGCVYDESWISVHVYFNFKFIHYVRNVVLFADPLLFQAL